MADNFNTPAFIAGVDPTNEIGLNINLENVKETAVPNNPPVVDKPIVDIAIPNNPPVVDKPTVHIEIPNNHPVVDKPTAVVEENAGIPGVIPENEITIEIDMPSVPVPEPEQPKPEPEVPANPTDEVVKPADKPAASPLSNVGVTSVDTVLNASLSNNGATGYGVNATAVSGSDKVNNASGIFASAYGTKSTEDNKMGVTLAGAVGALNHSDENATGYGLGVRGHRTIYDGVNGRTNLTADVKYSGIKGLDEVKNAGVAKDATTFGVGATHTLSNDRTTINAGVQHQVGTTYDGRKTNANQVVAGVTHQFNSGANIGLQSTLGVGGNVDANAFALTGGWSNRQALREDNGHANPLMNLTSPPTKPENLNAEPKVPETPAINIRLGEKELFEHDSAMISINGKERLSQLATQLKDTNMLASGRSIEQTLKSSNQQINILGNTDATGSNQYNLRLSEARAGNVMRYLESKGVDTSIMRSIGNGETSAKFNDAAVQSMRASGKSREEIHRTIQDDRNVTISIPGEYTLKNGNDVASRLGGSVSSNANVASLNLTSNTGGASVANQKIINLNELKTQEDRELAVKQMADIGVKLEFHGQAQPRIN